MSNARTCRAEQSPQSPEDSQTTTARSGSRNNKELRECVACPICRSADISDFISIDSLPIHVCALFASASKARDAALGHVILAYCHACTFVFNRRFDPGKFIFEPGYNASLAYTTTFRTYARDLAQRLVQQYALRRKTVLEIGCGDGYFLQQLCQLGKNRGIGIDPTIKQERVERSGAASIRFVSDYFSDRYRHLAPDFICNMSVFESVPKPREFLADLLEMIGERNDVIVYFEVPNAAYMFDKESTWSIYYEQVGHFTRENLAGLFRQCGFEVLASGSCYEGDQYIFVEARVGEHRREEPATGVNERSELPDIMKRFNETHRANVEQWRNKLLELDASGKRVVAWGSGGKGNSFLNLLQTEKQVRYVVDINPVRQGKFIPGSAQEIVAPEFVTEYQPDAIIVTNPIYEEEIRMQVADLGVNCDFLLL